MTRTTKRHEGRVLEARGFSVVGAVVSFALRAVRGFPKSLAYGGELVRQMGILATGSALVIMFVSFMAGSSCGLEGAYVARALTTPALSPGIALACSVTYVVPFLYGFVLAAKVGCGLCAEIGAMRIRDEIDAVDVLGVNSMVYLISVRFLAAMLVLPVVYALSMEAAALGAWTQSFVRFHDVSRGTYAFYFYAFDQPIDLLFSLLQGVTLTAVILVVSLYFGYTVRGGPVDVGTATAKTMGVCLVLVTLVNLIWVLMFLLRGQVPIA